LSVRECWGFDEKIRESSGLGQATSGTFPFILGLEENDINLKQNVDLFGPEDLTEDAPPFCRFNGRVGITRGHGITR
jgi:hypothetical protein